MVRFISLSLNEKRPFFMVRIPDNREAESRKSPEYQGKTAQKLAQYGLKVLQLSEKAAAAPGQSGDIMPQVKSDTFHGEGVAFVMDIEDVLSREDHVQIAAIPICAVSLRFRGCIHHPLDCSERFVRTHHMTCNLWWLSSHPAASGSFIAPSKEGITPSEQNFRLHRL